MKTFRILLLMVAATAFFSFRSDNTCESYFPVKVGTKWEQTSYDAKDKVVSKVKGELTAANETANGVEVTMNVESQDDKGKALNKGEMKMKCEGDKFYMDMSNLFQGGQMPPMEGMDVKIEISNAYMDFPSHPVAGQTLSDVTSTMTTTLNGTPFMTTTINMTNRKVEGFESVTTSAGTFDCVKFSYDSEVKSSMFNNKSHQVLWMCKNTGTVKMENYDDKGKLQSKNILTAFSN